MKHRDIVLRYIKESDIADYVRWTTTETEWGLWDAPWEDDDDAEFVERQRQAIRERPDFFCKLEIDTACGRHIGWVCCYEIAHETRTVTAVGIDIPGTDDRGKGYGEAALSAFMAYLFRRHDVLYAETWSGNAPMLRLAEKLGFAEIARITDYREVRGRLYDGLTFAIGKDEFFGRYPTLRGLDCDFA